MPDSRAWRRPTPWTLAAEAPRAVGELTAFARALPRLRRVPDGDGHPVLVLPGFLASDESTRPLRWFLREHGYVAHGWKLGRNLGPSDDVIDGLQARVAALVDQHGRTISVIGWSLGGIYAREIARQAPGAVRQVITLASPFRLGPRSASAARPLYQAVAANHSDRVRDPVRRGQRLEPLTVPTTAIYTKSDAIVPWRACIEDPGPYRQNIEVTGSHSGLGHNPRVLRIIADRLAQPEDDWRPYQPPS
jgi:pimeloyl-ACP methyl ester carboxylesterase